MEAAPGNILRYTVYTAVGERVIDQSITELLAHANPEQLAEELYDAYGGIFDDF